MQLLFLSVDPTDAVYLEHTDFSLKFSPDCRKYNNNGLFFNFLSLRVETEGKKISKRIYFKY